MRFILSVVFERMARFVYTVDVVFSGYSLDYDQLYLFTQVKMSFKENSPTSISKTFYTVPRPHHQQSIREHHPTHQPPFNHRIKKNLFPAINHDHLNPDETNQNLIHLLFFVLLHHETDYRLLLLRATFLYRIMENKQPLSLTNNIVTIRPEKLYRIF